MAQATMNFAQWQAKQAASKGGASSASPAKPTMTFAQWKAKQPQPSGFQKAMGSTGNFFSGLGTDVMKVGANIDQSLAKTAVGFGNELSATAGNIAPSISGENEDKQTAANYAQTITQMTNLIKTQKTKGKDVSNLTTALKGMVADSKTVPTFADLYPAVNDTAEQVIGNAAGVALDVVGAGELSGATEGATAATEGLTTGKRIIAGAKTGAAYGAGFGASTGMSDNENAGGVAVSTAVGAGTGALLGGTVQGAFGARPANTDLQDTISPKLTASEQKLAVDQGRVTQGKSSILFGKNPDTVAPIEQTARATATIKSNIPNYENMDQFQLTNALNDGISSRAESLKPEMEATPVAPETTSKIGDVWTQVKASQSETAEFADNEAGNAKFQSKFENYLNQVTDPSEPQSLNDLWDVRKSYDDSIPPSVKKATSASPAQLQYRRTMWLDNRAILNNAINDSSTGLGDTSQSAFQEMSDMYYARNNLIAKAKIDTTGSAGLLPNTGKGWLKAGLETVGGLSIGDYLWNKLKK